MLHKLTTAAISLCAVLAIHAQEMPDSVFEADPYFLLMGEADRAIADKNWAEAADRLSDALAVKPDHPSNALLLNNLASVYTCMQQDSLALDAYSRALDIAPNMVTVLTGRGRLLLANGRDAEAMNDFNRAISLDSLSTDARYFHGMISLYRGNLEQAERDFGILQSVAPKSFDTAIALATLYSLSGRERQAIPYLEQLIKEDASPEYYASLAGCHLALDELTEASQTIGDGLKLYPSDPELYYYRAWLNRKRFRNDDARADAERAISLGANPARVADLFRDKH